MCLWFFELFCGKEENDGNYKLLNDDRIIKYYEGYPNYGEFKEKLLSIKSKIAGKHFPINAIVFCKVENILLYHYPHLNNAPTKPLVITEMVDLLNDLKNRGVIPRSGNSLNISWAAKGS